MILIIAYAFSFFTMWALSPHIVATLPTWFMILWGAMCYTFVHYFFNIATGYIIRRRLIKQYGNYSMPQPMPAAKYQPAQPANKSTADVQEEIEKYAAELRQSALLTANVLAKNMYNEFEDIFTEFNNKLKAANDKYSKIPIN